MKCKDCTYFDKKNNFIGICKLHGGFIKLETEQCIDFIDRNVKKTVTVIKDGKKIITEI